MLLEVLLRITGLFYRYPQIYRGRARFRILCLGDSFTYGVGAVPSRNYPAWLYYRLNSLAPGEFTVVNKGISSYNTRMILSNLDSLLDKYNPGLVVILAGGANVWNGWGYECGNRRAGLKDYAVKLWRKLKIVKLAKLLARRIRSKAEHNLVGDVVSRLSKVDDAYILASYLYREHMPYKAIEILKKNVAQHSRRDRRTYYYFLGWIYRCLYRYKEAVKYLEKSISLQPLAKRHYGLLVDSAIQSGDKKLIKEVSSFIKKMLPRMPELKGYLAQMQNAEEYRQKVHDWIVDDIGVMASKIRSHGAKVILMNYPFLLPQDIYPQVNKTLEECSRRYSLPFVDNYSVFRSLYRSLGAEKAYIEKYISFDKQHVNALGYKIIAHNIVEVMKKKGFIGRDGREK